MESKFTVSQAFLESIKLGFKIFIVIRCGNSLAITIWIPYLNVGTTVAMVTLPAK